MIRVACIINNVKAPFPKRMPAAKKGGEGDVHLTLKNQ